MKRILPVSLAAMLVMAIFMLTACAAAGTAQPTVEAALEAIADAATTVAEAQPTAEADAAQPATDVTPTAAPVHFTYEGEEGPEHWATLTPANDACDDTHQSPIDLTGAAAQDLANLVFNYQPSAIHIKNNGHTVQVDYDPGSTLELDGHRYQLAQFHFHAPSEHTIDGRPAAAELHLVHAIADGSLPADSLAVVGVLIQEGAEDNPAFSAVWDNLYAANATAQLVDGQVNAAEMLPATQTTYRYAGSLTTPPCSETVAWNVMTEPIQMSAGQLAAFRDLFEGGNNRPVQRLNDRELTVDSTP